MKYDIDLDKSEEKIVTDYESGQYVSAIEEKQKFKEIAKATLNKTKNINLRVPEKDILKIKARAARSGIAYQTVMASLMHQYAEGDLKVLL